MCMYVFLWINIKNYVSNYYWLNGIILYDKTVSIVFESILLINKQKNNVY